MQLRVGLPCAICISLQEETTANLKWLFVQIIVFDIKAGNVLLDQDGITAKITDVGLSKMLAGSNIATLLVSADLASTRPIPYMATLSTDQS